MPQRTSTPLSVSGRPVHALVRARASDLADRLVAGFAEQIPVYRDLPTEELVGDIRAITVHNLNVIAEVFANRRPPTRSCLDPLRESAARRAQEGVPLEAILTAYHLGARLVVHELFASADAADVVDVVEANALVLSYTQAVTAAVCDAYLTEREAMLGQERDAAHAVVVALLNGESPLAAATLAGIRLASGYLVLSVRIGPHPDERGPGARVAGRRKRHRIETALTRRRGDLLSMMDSSGGLVLIPADGETSWPTVASCLAEASSEAGAPIWAAGDRVVPERVAEAARLTSELLEVVRAFDREPGLYRLGDLLLEYQLTRPSPARDRLASLLDPLDGHADLASTLRVHLEEGLDRRATAARLHVHPNTVDYRLRRIRGLVGADPTDPRAVPRIEAALAARRMTAARPGP